MMGEAILGGGLLAAIWLTLGLLIAGMGVISSKGHSAFGFFVGFVLCPPAALFYAAFVAAKAAPPSLPTAPAEKEIFA